MRLIQLSSTTTRGSGGGASSGDRARGGASSTRLSSRRRLDWVARARWSRVLKATTLLGLSKPAGAAVVALASLLALPLPLQHRLGGRTVQALPAEREDLHAQPGRTADVRDLQYPVAEDLCEHGHEHEREDKGAAAQAAQHRETAPQLAALSHGEPPKARARQADHRDTDEWEPPRQAERRHQRERCERR